METWDKDNIPKMIEIVNRAIEGGTVSIVQIAKEIFGKNESVLRKAFKKHNYYRVSKTGKYELKENIDNCITTVIQDKKHKVDKSITTVIQEKKVIEVKAPEALEIKEFRELLEMKEDLKNVIQWYNNSMLENNFIDVEAIEIKLDPQISSVGKAVGMRIDEAVYKEWLEFCTKHKRDFKSYQMLSQALIEFMKKYK